MRRQDKLKKIETLNKRLNENSLGGGQPAPTGQETYSQLTMLMQQYYEESVNFEEFKNDVLGILGGIENEINNDGMTHDQWHGETHGY